jgi:hypothetical protein
MKHCDMIQTNNSLFEVVSFNLRVTDLFYLQTNINVCTRHRSNLKQERRYIQKNSSLPIELFSSV